MSTTWKITTVRVRPPPEVLVAEFLAAMRLWLNHHCIMLADFRDKGDGFDALFDNPRDARLFERWFAARPTSTAPAYMAPRRLPTVTALSKEAPVLGDLIPVADAPQRSARSRLGKRLNPCRGRNVGCNCAESKAAVGTIEVPWILDVKLPMTWRAGVSRNTQRVLGTRGEIPTKSPVARKDGSERHRPPLSPRLSERRDQRIKQADCLIERPPAPPISSRPEPAWGCLPVGRALARG